ncbi:HlyD family type I secretion periplasmic adaptor subunit [Poseidonocella sp. HB161398]|uniref:HlyD family type I secretion periplasmic adaptor subunit n=1 Tax=Poseidonocella sp. HB161398 TaxID=2320855 RepID=UPI0011090874|nr:HlyD family type I secretion periplasmic adaptor subunit [Poseidonocella sp. HB161398]
MSGAAPIRSGRAAARRRGAETEFLPAALEILDTPASPAGRALALVIAAMFVLAIGWAVIGRVDVVAVAPGRVVAAEGNKVIQPLDLGVVRAIHVADGQHVAEGALLIELDPTESEVDLGQLRRQRAEQALEAARLGAFIAGLRGDPPVFDGAATGAPERLVRLHDTQLRSDLAAFLAQRASIEAERARLGSARASAAAELAKSEEILPLIRDREASSGQLFAQGLTSRPQYQQIRAGLIEAVHDLAIRRNRLAEAETALAAIDKELAFLVADRLRQSVAALTEAETAIDQIELALQRAEARKARQVLRAPVAGTVQELTVRTVGGVVQPADALMVIVADDAALEVRASLLNRDMGRLAEGQAVEIKLDAFNFTRYGTVPGRLRTISQDAVEREGLGLVYDARIALEATAIQADERVVSLAPGMTVSVEVKTGTRRIIGFLLSPLKRYGSEAIREP